MVFSLTDAMTLGFRLCLGQMPCQIRINVILDSQRVSLLRARKHCCYIWYGSALWTSFNLNSLIHAMHSWSLLWYPQRIEKKKVPSISYMDGTFHLFPLSQNHHRGSEWPQATSSDFGTTVADYLPFLFFCVSSFYTEPHPWVFCIVMPMPQTYWRDLWMVCLGSKDGSVGPVQTKIATIGWITKFMLPEDES